MNNITVRLKDISGQFNGSQEVIVKQLMNFMAEYLVYGFAIRSDGYGNYETTIEFDAVKASNWVLESPI